MDRNCCDEPSSVIEFVVGVAVDLVPIDARLVMFCGSPNPSEIQIASPMWVSFLRLSSILAPLSTGQALHSARIFAAYALSMVDTIRLFT